MGLDYISMGMRIRDRRTRAGMSQEKLAEKTSLRRSYISYVENGKKSISLEAVVEICNALEMPIEDLMVDNMVASRSMEGNDASYLLLDCTPEEQEILTKNMRSLRETLRRFSIRK